MAQKLPILVFFNISFYFKNQIPIFHCFDRQEAEMRSVEAHDGSMFQDFCINEQT